MRTGNVYCCGVSPDISDSCPPRGAGNTRLLSLKRGNAFNKAIAASDRGTRCSFPAFIRLPGIIHVFSFKSISFHSAPRTSPERATVSTENSSARAEIPARLRKSAMKGYNRTVGQCGMMLLFLNFTWHWQEGLEHTFPCCRVITFKVFSGFCVINDGFDTSTQATGGFVFC